MKDVRWLLPEGVDELLPRSAGRLEKVRRELLDLYWAWGYELVAPPFVEYLDSLLVGVGSDLDLQTFKVIDQTSGRLMGIRADITPQVARMDAHRLQRSEPNRLCYLGTVLRALPEGLGGSRNPLQIGAELFGHDGIESDVEILRLMLATLDRVGLAGSYLDIGHVGIFRSLAEEAGLDDAQEVALFDALQRKAIPEIEEMLDASGLSAVQADRLRVLAELNGENALEIARSELAGAADPVHEAIERLSRVAEALRSWLPGLTLHFDLGELRGYRFHTGIVFAAFTTGSGQEIARGGRYDGIGRAFGHARPATGFSADLKALMRLAPAAPGEAPAEAIFAPWSTDHDLRSKIETLRASGARVVVNLPGQQGSGLAMGCTRELRRIDGVWQVVPISA